MALEESTDGLTLQIRLIDTFGDNGMIASSSACPTDADWVIDTWLMSCRVLNRKLEETTLNCVVAAAKSAGVRALVGRYLPHRAERHGAGALPKARASSARRDGGASAGGWTCRATRGLRADRDRRARRRAGGGWRSRPYADSQRPALSADLAMLFNSYAFIFVFLPDRRCSAYFIVGRLRTRDRRARMARCWPRWRFTRLWNPISLAIILPSIVLDYLIATTLQSAGRRRERALRRLVLGVGIAANIALSRLLQVPELLSRLGQLAVRRRISPLAPLILPLGISFITFQKIAFLVDVCSRAGKEFRLPATFCCSSCSSRSGRRSDRALPGNDAAVRARRCALECRPTSRVAICLFSIGLFKKVVIADGIA